MLETFARQGCLTGMNAEGPRCLSVTGVPSSGPRAARAKSIGQGGRFDLSEKALVALAFEPAIECRAEHRVRERAASFAGVALGDLVQALVIEYGVGAGTRAALSSRMSSVILSVPRRR